MDIEMRDQGSLWTLDGGTDAGAEWIEENVSAEGYHAFAARIVEPRYAGDIIAGALDAGLTVEIDGREVVGIEVA